MRKSCNEVNHWGSQADSHVISYTEHRRRRRRGRDEMREKGKCYMLYAVKTPLYHTERLNAAQRAQWREKDRWAETSLEAPACAAAAAAAASERRRVISLTQCIGCSTLAPQTKYMYVHIHILCHYNLPHMRPFVLQTFLAMLQLKVGNVSGEQYQCVQTRHTLRILYMYRSTCM